MRFGLTVPNLGDYADPVLLAEMAHEAEVCGWDAMFLWDHLLYRLDPVYPAVDPWIALAAMASVTERLRLGPMVTPLARRRPQVVARQVATLDQLSGGRVIFGAGLGTPADAEFEAFGDPGDASTRAGRLDEGLAVVSGLLTGEPFNYSGAHVQVGGPVVFLPTPFRGRRVPVWIAARWPPMSRGPFRRAARWDGIFVVGGRQGPWISPSEVAEVRTTVGDTADGFDVAVEGCTDGPDTSVRSWADAGATWWLEHVSWKRADLAACRDRIRRGPPVQ